MAEGRTKVNERTNGGSSGRAGKHFFWHTLLCKDLSFPPPPFFFTSGDEGEGSINLLILLYFHPLPLLPSPPLAEYIYNFIFQAT